MAESAPDLAQAWLDLPRAHGEPPVAAEVRAAPEDFGVREDLGMEPEGAGEHLWVLLRKTGWNTADAGQWLASVLERPPRDVSWAGLKDRQAVTEQWFGVHMPGPQTLPPLPEAPGGLEVLRMARHPRKLRTGMLRGNWFRLRLREVDGDWSRLGQRLVRMAHDGVPNYFGDQRFGRDGGNLDAAWRMFDGMPVRNRHRRGLFLSAARSFLFNQVLAERVARGTWDHAVDGDLMTFTGSGSIFQVARLTAGDPRLAIADVHPSGPMPGVGGQVPTGSAGELENAVLAQWPQATAGLQKLKVDASRRALRLPLRELHWRRDDDALVLGFWLPAGAYATAVLRELCHQRERNST